MAKYDDASWHYEGDFPEDLPAESAATHIGMFLTWCIDNDLISEFQNAHREEDIQKIKNRKLTGAEFLIHNCDEKLTDGDLNDLGNDFAKDYYEEDTDFSAKFGNYLDDYTSTFDQNADQNDFEYETFYHVENTFENYEILKPIIDKRLEEWKKYRNN